MGFKRTMDDTECVGKICMQLGVLTLRPERGDMSDIAVAPCLKALHNKNISQASIGVFIARYP